MFQMRVRKPGRCQHVTDWTWKHWDQMTDYAQKSVEFER